MELHINLLGANATMAPESNQGSVDLEFWGRGNKSGAAILDVRDSEGNIIDRVLVQISDRGKIAIARKRTDV